MSSHCQCDNTAVIGITSVILSNKINLLKSAKNLKNKTATISCYSLT